jgi:hypothetical protein
VSVAIIKEQIFRFLNIETPEVLAIKGKWGVGKTYSWKSYLMDAQHQNKVNQKRYSYISLFGIDSLDELKFLIFQQAIPTKMIGHEPSIESFKDNAAALSESLGRKMLRGLLSISYLRDFSSAIRSLSFLSLNNSLVCIDDLERKGKNLAMRDVLGLISVLKEEKHCKVVLIYNDGSLEGEDLEDYKKYREKVIDVELEFIPTPQECADIALPKDSDVNRKLKNFSTDLRISNIRILIKIRRLAKILVTLLKDFEMEVTYQALHSLCLFSWCLYSPNDVSPDYEYVKNIGLKLYGFNDEKKLTDEEKLWNAILQNYKYLNTDELDLVIAKAVEKGYVVENELISIAKKQNAQIVAAKGEQSFSDIWRLYHDTFEDNQEEVIKKLYEGLKKYAKYVTPINLVGTVRLLRELSRNDLADKAIDYYINARKDEIELFNLDNYAFSEDINDKVIIQKFKDLYLTDQKPESLRDVLDKITRKDGWGSKDIDLLAKATTDDYYNLFKSETGEHLSTLVNACLRFRRSGHSNEQQNAIADMAIEALKRIGSESAINKIRVKKYGIYID